VIEKKALATCPRRDQIRFVSFHYYAAKGPMSARSMGRKALGNEEYCMQIDAHTSFAKDWDDILKKEWKNTGNEFGVISTVPPPKAEQESYQPGGDKEKEVPRQCRIRFNDNGFPVSSCCCAYVQICVYSSTLGRLTFVCLLPSFVTLRITCLRPSDWLWICNSRFFLMAGRRPFPLPSVILKKVCPTTRLRHGPSLLSSFLGMRECGHVGTYYCSTLEIVAGCIDAI